jgi:hypothetical protein
MTLNTTINILGGLPDWNLVIHLLATSRLELEGGGNFQVYTSLKTTRSVERFERAIRETLIRFQQEPTELLFAPPLLARGITPDNLLLLFWNASYNNDLLSYLNKNVYFPAFYSGRISIKSHEVVACMQELNAQPEMQSSGWADYTVEKVASKYLTLLGKFGLMEGSQTKTIVHPNLVDTLFVLFVYWLCTIADKPNLLQCQWLEYGFSEKQAFVDRLSQKKFSKYFQFKYTGDNLKIEPSRPYHTIYHDLIYTR